MGFCVYKIKYHRQIEVELAEFDITFYVIYLTGKLHCHGPLKEAATWLCALALSYVFQNMLVLLSRVENTYIIELVSK